MLKMRQETVNVVDSYDLDKFIQSAYDLQAYEFVPCEEVGNDSHHMFRVKAENIEGDEYQNGNLRMFRAGKFQYYMTQSLLDDLAYRGEIPEGTYIISVSW
jgi:hypothetical protein